VSTVDKRVGELWHHVLAVIEGRLSKPSFETWLKSTKAIALQDNTVIVAAPNEFVRDHLERSYTALIRETLQEVAQQALDVKFVLPPQHDETERRSPSPSSRQPRSGSALADDMPQTMLNPKYTFDTFVVGQSNRFAHAACLAVAELPAKAYNPLFIYGGVGLGKTHLMHAIGHYVLQHNPGAKVVYLSSEKFTNEFITAIQYNRTEDFRNKYRKVDVLLIDDIQFLAGKERIQEEFFHTFNALHEENKQIVISSDRPPREIPTLEDRLRSRFEWGLITDIHPPDLETRIAILRKKVKAENLDIPDDVLLYIANQIDSNIRELEGALLRVVAYSAAHQRDIDLPLAVEALRDIVSPSKPRKITIADIQKVVGAHFGLRLEDLIGKKRTKNVAYPRQIAMYLARELTDASLPKIGSEFGGRDHTTVIHAHEKISRELQTNPELQALIQQLTEQLKHQP